MPRAKKKVAGNSNSLPNEGKPVQDSYESQLRTPARSALSQRPDQNKTGQRKRGWRDIEAISERARLKKMLVDIWHEDVELDEDIFGTSDHLYGYYTDEEVAEEIEIDDELIDDEEDFEEKEEAP